MATLYKPAVARNGCPCNPICKSCPDQIADPDKIAMRLKVDCAQIPGGVSSA